MRLEGLNEAVKKLLEASEEVRLRAVPRTALKQGRKLRNAIRQLAPVRSGNLASAVFYRRDKRAETRDNVVVTAGIRRRKAYYFAMVELGTVKQPGQFYMTRAFNREAAGILQDFTADLTAAVNKLGSK